MDSNKKLDFYLGKVNFSTHLASLNLSLIYASVFERPELLASFYPNQKIN